MAGAAETIQIHQFDHHERLAENVYLPVDAIPEVASARLVGRREAYEIVEQNRQHLLDG